MGCRLDPYAGGPLRMGRRIGVVGCKSGMVKRTKARACRGTTAVHKAPICSAFNPRVAGAAHLGFEAALHQQPRPHSKIEMFKKDRQRVALPTWAVPCSSTACPCWCLCQA